MRLQAISKTAEPDGIREQSGRYVARRIVRRLNQLGYTADGVLRITTRDGSSFYEDRIHIFKDGILVGDLRPEALEGCFTYGWKPVLTRTA